MDVMGNFPVKSVTILVFRSRILVKNELVLLGIGFIGYFLLGAWYCCLVDLSFLFVWCMCPLAVASNGGRLFWMRSRVILVHMVS